MLLRPQHTPTRTALAAMAVAGATVVAAMAPAAAAPRQSHAARVAYAPHSGAAREIAVQFVDAVNAARMAHGLLPVARSVPLTHLADQHSYRMAYHRALFHNLAITSELNNWVDLGENVGEGPSEQLVHDAFMHSPEHRANILDPHYTQVGIGVAVDRSGQVWVTEDFRRPEAGTRAAHHAAVKIHRILAAQS